MNQTKRLFLICFIFFRYGLDEVVLSIPVLSPVRYIYYLNPWHWRKKSTANRGKRIRLALEQLGPVFVKFGQMLSTRPDLFSEEIIKELALLQDRVPPFSADKVRKIVEETYCKPLKEIFKTFNAKALASASVAQVHEATLWSDENVVVKILRPHIMAAIKQDVALLYLLAKLSLWFSPKLIRFKPKKLVAECETTLMSELDLRCESANASLLRRNFENSHLLYVPKVYWQFTQENVMVQERIYGVPIAQLDVLRSQGFNLKQLAELGIEIFFTGVFKHNFFHADMHPGNIFISGEPEAPRYTVVDFGIMGTLTTQDQRYLAENLLAFFNRDYRRVAELHRESGWVPSDVRLVDFEAAMRTVCEPMFEKPMHEISFGQVLLQLIQTAQQFRIEIQPQLMLIQKTLVNIEGLGRQLYPELDLWKTAKPFLECWVRQQLGPRAFFKKVKANLPYWLEKMPELPDLIYKALQMAADQDKKQIVKPPVKHTNYLILLTLVCGIAIGAMAMALSNVSST